MHRRPEVEQLPLDTELERTLRNLKKVRIVEAITMAEQEGTDQHVLVKANNKKASKTEDYGRFLEASH